MEIKIREIKKVDMEVVIEMLQDISKWGPQKNNFNKVYKEFISQSNVLGFVYLYNNNIVGYGCLVFEFKIRGSWVGHIEDIVVNKKFRGKNIGKKIIHHLIEESKKRNCFKVSLGCGEHNVKFYEKCGLMVDGRSMKKFI